MILHIPNYLPHTPPSEPLHTTHLVPGSWFDSHSQTPYPLVPVVGYYVGTYTFPTLVILIWTVDLLDNLSDLVVTQFEFWY